MVSLASMDIVVLGEQITSPLNFLAFSLTGLCFDFSDETVALALVAEAAEAAVNGSVAAVGATETGSAAVAVARVSGSPTEEALEISIPSAAKASAILLCLEEASLATT